MIDCLFEDYFSYDEVVASAAFVYRMILDVIEPDMISNIWRDYLFIQLENRVGVLFGYGGASDQIYLGTI